MEEGKARNFLATLATTVMHVYSMSVMGCEFNWSMHHHANDRCWPKIVAYFHVTGDRLGAHYRLLATADIELSNSRICVDFSSHPDFPLIQPVTDGSEYICSQEKNNRHPER